MRSTTLNVFAAAFIYGNGASVLKIALKKTDLRVKTILMPQVCPLQAQMT